jgi:small subunit ribosomal protein S12
MSTKSQLIRSPKKQLGKKYRSFALGHAPQRKGICVKVYTTSPKKPNSARRKVAQVKLSTRRMVICYIPGEGHNLVNFHGVLVRGGRVPDLPGVKYVLVRGVYDLQAVRLRRHGRSKYGRNRDFRAKFEFLKFPTRPVKKKMPFKKTIPKRVSFSSIIL